MSESQKRTDSFSRVPALEQLLEELNSNLADANQKYLTDSSEKFPKIFLVGPLRSGTTLLMQWLATTGLVAYPTNLLSRFYGAPLVGARIQQLLTDPVYNFRNEILDFQSEISFRSENGKTKGALAPNEFWYFWRRFLPFSELDYLPAGQLKKQADLDGLRDELNALANIFQKPFAMKAMIMNQNIAQLAEQFDKALFLWIRRPPVFNIQSALEARKRQHGDMRQWYSFKIREYPELKDLEPLESVAGQIAATNCSIERAMTSLPEVNKLVIHYEEFCQDPERAYHDVVSHIERLHGERQKIWPSYKGEKCFYSTNVWRLEEYSQLDAEQAYAKYFARYA
ncbi:sulfotransferase [Marinobacteraceae bacterium S3BR75-40.1]